jgi:hypothetical protein
MPPTLPVVGSTNTLNTLWQIISGYHQPSDGNVLIAKLPVRSKEFCTVYYVCSLARVCPVKFQVQVLITLLIFTTCLSLYCSSFC